jgi:hypothetical protein
MFSSLSMVLLMLCFANVILSMPYLVPLHGSPGGHRTLILLEKVSEKHTFSLFFNGIVGMCAFILCFFLIIKNNRNIDSNKRMGTL